MAASLHLTLDDIIIKNITKNLSGSENFSGRAPPSRSRPGPDRRFPSRSINRAAPYGKVPETTWKHDLYANEDVAYSGRASSTETGTKLYITNLDYGVSDDDIKELFSEVGDLKQHGIHYDKSGRSKGTAEVVFLRGADAVAAVKRYNNVQLDGKLMKIEIVGANISIPTVVPSANRAIGNSNRVPRSGQGRGGEFRRPGGRGQGIQRGRGRGRVRDGGRAEKISAEDLDADLEKYHAKAMELN